MEARPLPDVYTVLMLVAIVALAAAIGVVLYNLLSPLRGGYGLGFGQIFTGGYLPERP
jgi:hypothetical protein